MKANLSAKNLLGVLSILPDGLHLKHLNKFDDTLVDLDITSCLQTLLQCSLIKLNEERYQPHPIVQHYCLNHGMLLSKHKAAMEKLYITLALSEYTTVSSEVYGEMVLEVNNTKAIILSLLNSNYKDDTTLITASIVFTKLCISIGDHSDKVISQAIEFVQRNSGSRLLLIKSLYQLGAVYFYGANYEKAKEKLQEAEKLCLYDPLAYSNSYGPILENIGNIYRLLGALNDAETSYQKSLSIWKDRNDIYGQGVLYAKLGNLYRRLGKLDEAVTLHQSAIQSLEGTDPITQGKNYKGLGWVYLRQNKLIEAENALQKALRFHQATNHFLDLGNDYEILGKIYLELKRFEDAKVTCEKALEFHKLANDALGQGNDHRLFGRINLSQGRLNEAEISFKKALELHAMANSASGQKRDSSFLKKIYEQRVLS